MSEERFRELRAQVEHIGKIKHLSDDALLALGGAFGELKSKINEQAERVEKLKTNISKLKQWKFETDPYVKSLEKQNKRYREALQSILDYNHHELTIPLDVIEVIEKALESEE